MPFDLKNLHPPARFYWDGDKTEWIELTTLTPKELTELRKKCTEAKVEYYLPEGAKGQPFRYEYHVSNDELYNEMFWDARIANWNFCQPDGNQIPCTKENKLLLLGGSTEFAAWVMRCLEKLERDQRARAEKLEKN